MPFDKVLSYSKADSKAAENPPKNTKQTLGCADEAQKPTQLQGMSIFAISMTLLSALLTFCGQSQATGNEAVVIQECRVSVHERKTLMKQMIEE